MKCLPRRRLLSRHSKCRARTSARSSMARQADLPPMKMQPQVLVVAYHPTIALHLTRDSRRMESPVGAPDNSSKAARLYRASRRRACPHPHSSSSRTNSVQSTLLQVSRRAVLTAWPCLALVERVEIRDWSRPALDRQAAAGNSVCTLQLIINSSSNNNSNSNSNSNSSSSNSNSNREG